MQSLRKNISFAYHPLSCVGHADSAAWRKEPRSGDTALRLNRTTPTYKQAKNKAHQDKTNKAISSAGH